MTLTIKLDLDMVQVDLHVKSLVVSAVRVLTDGHAQTDRTDSITQPLTQEAIIMIECIVVFLNYIINFFYMYLLPQSNW